MKVGIVGGGLMGLCLAHRLSTQGHVVKVFEAAPQLGGLATHQDFGEFTWDRFYHVILPTDKELLGFIDDIGLSSQMRWNKTLTGYYVDQKTHSLSTPLEYLRFPVLSLWSKIRLALTILYCSRIDDWKKLEEIPLEDWLIAKSGKATFTKMWQPLLLAKLGENYRRVSAVFIWSYIKRMFSARDSGAKNEQLGHVSGGYKAVFDRISEQIHANGGSIATQTSVVSVHPSPGAGVNIQTDAGTESFDKVICTGPVNVVEKIADPSLLKVTKKSEVEYLGVACGVAITKKPLTPYYVLNLADDRIPFTGVIGMSNVVDPSETAGYHLTYLPKYVLSTDALLQKSEDDLRPDFEQGLLTLFPELSKDDIVDLRVFKAIKVQPLQVVGYSELIPSWETRHPDFFILNTSQFVNNTLNNNEVVSLVSKFLERHSESFAGIKKVA